MNNLNIIKKNLNKRYRREKRFYLYGISALVIASLFLLLLLFSILKNSMPAWTKTYIKLDIDTSSLALEKNADEKQIRDADYSGLINESIYALFPNINDRKDKRKLKKIISSGAQFILLNKMLNNFDVFYNNKKSIWLPTDDDMDILAKGLVNLNLPEEDRRVKNFSVKIYEELLKKNKIKTVFNTEFFTNSDSREPELAGILGSLSGSFWTIILTLLFSFPLAVATGVFLEELAPKNNRFIKIIEVNINNLAAVPSIVFGLLGLAVFINFMHIPRSVPLVGALVLTLMTLPTIIIATRAALKSVPPSIREAAMGMGASRIQTIFHHVVPLAMPGILTGTILGIAQAIGETAPLLMIGMVAFIVDVPSGVFDVATVLPVQIFLWSDAPEVSFKALTSAAIVILLLFVILMNLLAFFLRNKLETKW
jgi:phosphate transport system permease protein